MLLRCKLRSVAMRMAIPSMSQVRSCSNLQWSVVLKRETQKGAGTNVFSGPKVQTESSRYAWQTSTLL